MITYIVGKLAPNSINFTRGLVKQVPGRGYFQVVPSQNGDYIPAPSQSLNASVQPTTSRIGKLALLIHTLLYVISIHPSIHT